MRTLTLILPLLLALPACKFKNETRFVSVDPDYAYTDGCTAITLSGSNLGTDGSATIGGNPVEGLAPAVENPDLPDHAQDVGFVYTGLSPEASDAEGGFVDVTLTVDGADYVLDRGFYYIACPDGLKVDFTSEGEANAPGDIIGVSGCGLDDDGAEAVFYDDLGVELAAVPLESDCRGAEVNFAVPTLPDGTYTFQIRDDSGATYGDVCTDVDLDSDSDTDTDTDPCADLNLIPFTISSGGAR